MGCAEGDSSEGFAVVSAVWPILILMGLAVSTQPIEPVGESSCAKMVVGQILVDRLFTTQCEGILCSADAQKYLAQTAQLLSRFKVEIDQVHLMRGVSRVERVHTRDGSLTYLLRISKSGGSHSMTLAHEFTHVVLDGWIRKNPTPEMTKIQQELEWALEILRQEQTPLKLKAEHTWAVVAGIRYGFEEVLCDLTALSTFEDVNHWARMGRYRNYGEPMTPEFVEFYKSKFNWKYSPEEPGDPQYKVFAIVGRHLWQKHLAKATRDKREWILFTAAQTIRDSLPREIELFRNLPEEERAAQAVKLNDRLIDAVDKALTPKTPRFQEMQDMVDSIRANSPSDP